MMLYYIFVTIKKPTVHNRKHFKH